MIESLGNVSSVHGIHDFSDLVVLSLPVFGEFVERQFSASLFGLAHRIGFSEGILHGLSFSGGCSAGSGRSRWLAFGVDLSGLTAFIKVLLAVRR